MKKRTHKYFRNQRHKEKLKAKSYGSRTYWSHVMYFTKEPDPRDIRESYQYIVADAARRGISIEEAVNRHINNNWYSKHAKGKYIYYDRPEVPHSIQKVHTSPSYSRRRKELCRAANRQVRQRSKQYGEVYNHKLYRKLYDVAWELD